MCKYDLEVCVACEKQYGVGGTGFCRTCSGQLENEYINVNDCDVALVAFIVDQAKLAQQYIVGGSEAEEALPF